MIAGATGLVGSAAARYALDCGYRAIALVRSGRVSGLDQPLLARGLEAVELDFERADALKDQIAPHRPTSVLCALGTTIRRAGSQSAFARVDRDYVASLADAGRAAGAS